jgi:hypothetical protein
LHDLKALQSEAVNGLDRDDLWVSVYKKSLDLNPLFLLIGKVVRTLSLFNFFVELVYNNGDEQIHNEECGEENENDEDYSHPLVGLLFWDLVDSDTIDSCVHHTWPHFKS